MVATPNTPNKKIIKVFAPIIKENYVTPEWVLGKGVDGIADALSLMDFSLELGQKWHW
jgi:hypothetical protein